MTSLADFIVLVWLQIQANNRLALASHRQGNRAGHWNPWQRKKLKGWQRGRRRRR